jgi:hypothetical protein
MTLNMENNKRRSFGDIHPPLARKVVLPGFNIQLSDYGSIKTTRSGGYYPPSHRI